ncbi:hypothetical protein GCM10009567_17730 [Rothia amarae]
MVTATNIESTKLPLINSENLRAQRLTKVRRCALLSATPRGTGIKLKQKTAFPI